MGQIGHLGQTEVMLKMGKFFGFNISGYRVIVPKSLFRNTHWVDNLCQCESFLADLPEISGFALTPDFAEIQERYVSAAG